MGSITLIRIGLVAGVNLAALALESSEADRSMT